MPRHLGLPLLVLWCAAQGLALPSARADTSTASSATFTVDLQSLAGGLAVNGRVRAAQGGAAISGAAVSLAGQNTTTAGDGTFALSGVVLASGNTLTVSKAGYVTRTETASVPAGTKSITLPDIMLQAATAGRPVVTKVEPRLKGLFLSGASLNNDFTASVNWNGLSPGYVRFFANDLQVADKTGSGPDYVCTIDMAGASFSPAFNPYANKVRVVAVSSTGAASDPFLAYVGLVPLPDPLKLLTAQRWPFTTYVEGHVALDFEFPDPPIKADLDLPVIGRYGFEFAANASFDYTVTDGDWEAAFGFGAEGKQGKRGRRPTIPGLTRYPRMNLYIGNKKISGKLEAGARGTATIERGITFDQVFGHGELEAKLELGRLGLLDLLGPGLSSMVGGIPGLGSWTKTVSIIIYVIPGIDGEVTFALDPVFAFETLEMTGKVGLEAAYEPKLSEKVKLRVYVGCEGSVTLQVPGDLFKQVRFKAYAGAEFEAWFFTIGPVEYVFVDVTYPPSGAPASAGSKSQIARLKVLPESTEEVRPMSRAYREAGPELFVACDSAQKSLSNKGASALDSFRQLSQSAVRGSVGVDSALSGESGGPEAGPKDAGSGSETNQADLTLVQNTFPGSSPALAARGTELMLLYVTDNGMTNDLQYTDIAWTRWDGTNWSAPLAICTNTQAEFAPQVAYDGNGDAIAVWERVADSNFNQTNLTAMAAQMDLVWARWDQAAKTWTEPAALLAANSVVDFAPLLCGPMTNGDALLLWTRDYDNQLISTNPAQHRVGSRLWRAATQSWVATPSAATGQTYQLSQSLAGSGNRAVYAWTRDADGVLTNDTDQEVFYCEWADGTWGPVTQYATNSVADKNARAAVSPSGDAYLIWQQGTNLVMSKNLSTNVSLVRADSQTAGFLDYSLAFGPAGNLVLLWQEMSTNGSDAHYMVHDPASDTWSKDMLLCQDSPLERSFAPVWDNVGNLTVAYNKVQILYTNKTVTVEGGGTVTITNVPQPGRVDLCVTKRALIKDLALMAGDFTIQGNNYLPGDPLTLSAAVRNAGDVAVSNAVVSFYDGHPDAGGTLITNLALSGWVEAAGSNLLSALWVVPEPATNHTLYAVVDRAGAVTEFNETNNTQSLNIGGSDLAVGLVSYQAETNGAMRVIAQVQNLGAPNATNSVLAIRRKGETNAPLATAEVPLLEPGRLAQVALDLPAGTQPSGEALYTLRADEGGAVSDVDTNNNTTSFAVNLWIDSDGDGIPDDWMMEYFGHATGQAGDLSRAADDADGDGMSNLAEYLAGTYPKDPNSYLLITSVSAGGTNGVLVVWGSAANKLYSVQRAPAVGSGAGFTNLAEHILSTPPENGYWDTTATNGAAFFYRIQVE